MKALILILLPVAILGKGVQPREDYPRVKAANSQKWGYGPSNGPHQWPKLFPEFCNGIIQSPVNINTGGVVETYNKNLRFTSSYSRQISGKIKNDGHSIKFEPDNGGKLRITGEGLNDGVYELLNVHFHWGSEHTIDGVRYPLELHAVHTNTKYSTPEEFLNQPDGIVVLGFLFQTFKKGTYNIGPKSLNVFKEAAETIANSVDQLDEKIPAKINLGDFLEAVDRKNFFQYHGSLTTPTCNEVVTWIVFEKPINMSPSVTKSFRKLEDENGSLILKNFRHVQALNGRTVYHHTKRDKRRKNHDSNELY